MRSKTESPCPRRAEVEIMGVAFCGPCAREQEAYFAIGELTRRRRGTSQASRWPRHWRECGGLAREVRISVWMQIQWFWPRRAEKSFRVFRLVKSNRALQYTRT